MASRKKAAKAGAGAVAAGQAVRSNAYIQRLIEDEELRTNLRTAYDSAKRAYTRMNGKGPTKALEDKKVQRELREAATSLREAADGLRGAKKKKGRRKRRRGAGTGPQRGSAQEGPGRPVRRRGGVRVHREHDSGALAQRERVDRPARGHHLTQGARF